MKRRVVGQIIGCLPVDLDPAGYTSDTGGIITHFSDPALRQSALDYYTR